MLPKFSIQPCQVNPDDHVEGERAECPGGRGGGREGTGVEEDSTPSLTLTSVSSVGRIIDGKTRENDFSEREIFVEVLHYARSVCWDGSRGR